MGRSEVNNRIVVFDSILEDIWDNRFTVNLPSVFKVIADGKPPTVDNPFTEGKAQQENRNKRKCNSNEKSNKIINDKVDDDLKTKDDESWRMIFCGNNIKHRVTWSPGVLMCPRWFPKQYCFGDCAHKASHVPDNKVPEGKRKTYKSYLEKIRK